MEIKTYFLRCHRKTDDRNIDQPENWIALFVGRELLRKLCVSIQERGNNAVTFFT